MASISNASSVRVSSDAQFLDLHGYSVIPGLVGMHDHLFYPMGDGIFGEMAFSFPRLYLAAGVTTIRTGGSLEPYTDLELKKQIDDGASPGPKMHVTGPYLEGKGTFALQLHQLSGPDDAIRTVTIGWMKASTISRRTTSSHLTSFLVRSRRPTSAGRRPPGICAR